MQLVLPNDAECERVSPLEHRRKHIPIVAIPLALKSLLGVEPSLEPQEIHELRICGQNLLPSGPAMVGQKVAATVGKAAVDQLQKILPRFFHALRSGRNVEIEDRARVGLLRPRQHRLGVALDETNSSINELSAGPLEIVASVG